MIQITDSNVQGHMNILPKTTQNVNKVTMKIQGLPPAHNFDLTYSIDMKEKTPRARRLLQQQMDKTKASLLSIGSVNSQEMKIEENT